MSGWKKLKKAVTEEELRLDSEDAAARSESQISVTGSQADAQAAGSERNPSKRLSLEDAVGLMQKANPPKGLSRLRRSLENLMARRGSGTPAGSKEAMARLGDRLELDIPRPTLPGIGPRLGDVTPMPEFWDPEATPDKNSTLTFDRFRKSRSVQVSPDLRFATYRGQPFGGYICGWHILAKTPAGRYFEVQIAETDVGRWSDGLGVGFTTHHGENFPKVDPDNYESLACENLPQSWLVGYDGRAVLQGRKRFLKGHDFPAGPWKPAELVVGDVIGVLATEEGHILLFVNEEHRVTVPWAGVPWRPNLYAVVDLDGCTRTVEMLDSNDGRTPNHVVNTKAQVCHALSGKPSEKEANSDGNQ